MIGVAIVIGFVLSRSLFGFRLKAIGGNPAGRRARPAADPSSTSSPRSSSARSWRRSRRCSTSRSSARSSRTPASALLFPVFAAVIIGGASLAGGRGTAIGTLSGALLLAIIANGLALLSAGSYLSNFVLGRRDHRRRRARPVHPEPPPMSDARSAARRPMPATASATGGGLSRPAHPRPAQVVRRHARPRRARPRGQARRDPRRRRARTAPARARSSRSSPARPPRTPGEIELDGRRGTRASDRDRVAVVHQEPQLFPNLTVAENLMVGREGTRGCSSARLDAARALAHGATWRSSTSPTAARRCPAGDPAARRDRSRAGARRARLPVRRAELGADPGGVERPLPADAPARRRRPRRAPGLPPDRRAGRARRPRRPDPRRRVHRRPRGRGADPGGHRRRARHRPGRRASPSEQVVAASARTPRPACG